MKEYIDREALLDAMPKRIMVHGAENVREAWGAWNGFAERINDIPAADVVEVVRCKDCKWHKSTSVKEREHCSLTGIPVESDDFCSYGERKTDA